jgi:hypothetical protein
MAVDSQPCSSRQSTFLGSLSATGPVGTLVKLYVVFTALFVPVFLTWLYLG